MSLEESMSAAYFLRHLADQPYEPVVFEEAKAESEFAGAGIPEEIFRGIVGLSLERVTGQANHVPQTGIISFGDYALAIGQSNGSYAAWSYTPARNTTDEVGRFLACLQLSILAYRRGEPTASVGDRRP